MGQPVESATGSLVYGSNGKVELYTAATIGNNTTQLFDYTGGASNVFTLSAAPNGYIAVTIAGTTIPPGDVQVSGDQVTVTVSPPFMPATGSQVAITYRLSVMYHQVGTPIYTQTAHGIWVQATYSGGQPEYYLGDEPVLDTGGEQVYYTDAQPLPVATPFHEVTLTSGMPGTLYFRGVSSLTIQGGSGNNIYTIVQTQLGNFGMPGTDSTSVTLSTGNGNDLVAVDSIQSPVTVNAGNGQDTIDIGTLAGLWPNLPSDDLALLSVNGVVGQISSTLTVNGGSGDDTLNIDDSGDSATATGTLTNDSLTGLGMAGEIVYSSIATVNVNLGSGAVTFTIASTLTGATTNLQGGDGGDTINVQTIAGPTNLGLGLEGNTVNVGTDAGVNGFNFNGVLSGIAAALTVNGQPLAAQYVYPTSNPVSTSSSCRAHRHRSRRSPSAARSFPALTTVSSARTLTLTPPSADLTTGAPLIVVIAYTLAAPGFDNLVADDSGDTNSQTGTLTYDTLVGLGMAAAGIVYDNINALFIQLGLASDTFFVANTHTGTTNINGGPGNDTFNVESVEGGTEIQGYDPVVPQAQTFVNLANATFVRVHPLLTSDSQVTVTVNNVVQTYGVGYTYVLGTQLIDFSSSAFPSGVTGTVTVAFNGNPQAYMRTSPPPSPASHGDTFNVNVNQAGQENLNNNGVGINGVGALLAIDPQLGTNTINAYLTGVPYSASEPVSLIDVHDSGPLSDINTLNVYGSNSSSSSDQFLVRSNFVAIVQIVNGVSATAERVNYDSTVNNGGLDIYGRASNDFFALDDSSAKLTIYGGTGSDTFQVGQLFQSPTNDPQYPFADDDVSRTETTAGWLSNGISQPATLIGGTGADTFTVFRNLATLTLIGGPTNNTFLIRAFALYGSEASDQLTTDVYGGSGANLIEYAVNAPVNVFGGAGTNTVIVLGTSLGDQFVITPQGVYGAGLFANLINIQYLDIDGVAGDNHFVVLGTDPGVVTHIYGGEGSNTFDVGGDSSSSVLQVAANDEEGYNGLIDQNVSSSDSEYNGVVTGGISANIGDANQAGVVITPIGLLQVVEGSTTLAGLSSASGDGSAYAEYSVVLTMAPEEGQTVAVDVAGDGLGQPIQFYSAASPPAPGQPTFAPSVVLLFSASNWDVPQDVYVVAPNDNTPEGAEQDVTQSFTYESGPATFALTNLVRSVNSVTVNGQAIPSSDYTASVTTLTVSSSVLAAGDSIMISYLAPNGSVEPEYIENSVTASAPSAALEPYDDYRNVTARDLSIQVADTDSGGAIFTPVNPTTGLAETSTNVFKGSTTGDGFDVVLSHSPLAGESVSVNFTIPQGLLLSYNGSSISSLSFTAANWNIPDLVTITDPQNTTVQGQYVALIQSTITTKTTAAQGSLYANIASPTLTVNVIDDNSAGVYLEQAGGLTNVIEATPGITSSITADAPYTDTYTVVLTKQPAANVTVTEMPQLTPTGGTLVQDFTYSQVNNNQLTLLYAPADDNTVAVTIAGQAVPNDEFSVSGNTLTFDGVAAQAGTTIVAVTYQISGSADNLVLSSPNGQTTSGGGVILTFTPSDWNIPQTVTVCATDDNVINGQQVVVFPQEPKTVDQVQGPLIIDAGPDPALSLTAPPPLLFVGENDTTPPIFVPPYNPNLLEQKPQAVDVLNVLNDNEIASVSGTLTATTITGLGMGPNVVINGQTEPGGITYNNIQDVNIDLGDGTDDFLVETTDGGSTTINGGTGVDQVNIETTSGVLTVNGGSNTNTIDVGTNFNGSYFGVNINHFTSPAGGVLAQIDGLLRINGGGNTTVNLDNSGATDPSTSALTGETLNGLDLHAAIVQTVAISSAIGGTFTLQVGPGGPTTPALPYNISAATLQADLLALNLPNVTNVMVNQADSTYTIDFVGGAAMQGENLSITANGSGLISASSATASIQVSASVLDVVQSVTVAPTAGSTPVTIGSNLGTISISPGESASALQTALITAIDDISNPIVSASGVPVGTRDVQVVQADDTYYVLYQGLLRGTIGDEFLFSVPPVSTVSVQSSNSVNIGLDAVGGTYTIVTSAGPTYELAWNAPASALQSALDSLLGSTTISVAAITGGFAISNLPVGVASSLSIDYSQLNAPVVVTVQGQGIAYNNLTTLNLDLDPYDNVVNVQGTTAVTNIFGHGGNNQFFVSSVANQTQSSAETTDFLMGNLAGILGDLNIAAGNGVHKLYISNEGSVSGVPNGLITSNTSSNPNALPGTEVEVDGFAGPDRLPGRQRRHLLRRHHLLDRLWHGRRHG